ncbi:hypothetical protein [Flavobacterium hydatis]|jgi:hypothetical protein|uniref:Uncharacterized protein n=1 Tax=Flavobacterium hydatis TaxID=991 RepID=A0A086AEG8_FLAHY|nr:hypothetical protein [Flavobacterium hydatis]KFF15082.1 hypothetical protein IW20_15600 [Flavobacterium hydatis]
MGFFKKLGNAVKKGVKQISLKNAVKFGTPLLGAIPVVGSTLKDVVTGISEADQLRKQAREAEEQGKLADAQALQQQADYLAQLKGAQVGQQAGGVIKAFTKGATDEMLASVSNTSKEFVGNVGASVADQSIKAWFKKHWKNMLIALCAIIGGVYIYRKSKADKKKSFNRRK